MIRFSAGFKGSRGIREGVGGTWVAWEGLGACHWVTIPTEGVYQRVSFFTRGRD